MRASRSPWTGADVDAGAGAGAGADTDTDTGAGADTDTDAGAETDAGLQALMARRSSSWMSPFEATMFPT